MKKIIIIFTFILLLAQLVSAENLYVTASYSQKQVCPCTTSIYKFDIANIGSTQEIYGLYVDSDFADWTTFSNNNIILNPGDKSKVYAFITPGCSFYGSHTFNFYVKTAYTELKAKIPVELNIDPCYDYKVTLKDLTESICENQQTTIPITITNKAEFINSYKLSLESPKFAYLDYNKVQIPSNSEATVNLIIEAPVALEDDLDFELSVISSRGNLKQTKSFEINVENCYIPELEETKYTVSYNKTFTDLTILNTGNKQATYLLVLEAPDWASLEQDTITIIMPEETRSVKLITQPSSETRKGLYQASLTAIVNENNAQYTQDFNIELTKPGFFLKAFSAIKNNFKKILLYTLLLLTALLVALIAYLSIEKIKKIERKPKPPKIIEPVKIKKEIKKVEKLIKIEKEKKKKEKRKREPIELEFPKIKLNKKQKKNIIILLIGILLASLIIIDIVSFKSFEFGVEKNITIPDVVKEPQQVNQTYYDTLKDSIASSAFINFIKLYYIYLIIAAVLLIAIIIFILNKKKILKFKFEKKEKRKERKPVKIRKNILKTIFNILKKHKHNVIIYSVITLFTLALIILAITFWKIIKPYILYIIIGIVLLAILIFILLKMKAIKFRVRKKEIIKEEKKIVEKKIEKPKKIKQKRKPVKIKTIKSLLIASVVFVILMAFGLYVTLNYEEIGLQISDKKNFLEDFLDKTKGYMDSPSLDINITEISEPEELPSDIIFEGGIPPQTWSKNTIHKIRLLDYFTDPDGDKLEFAASLPANIAITIEGDKVTLSPEKDWIGTNTITFLASDTKGGYKESNEVYLIVEDKISLVSKLYKCKNQLINLFTDVSYYFMFYLYYIIAGIVILIVLILLISYNKRISRLVEENLREEKKR